MTNVAFSYSYSSSLSSSQERNICPKKGRRNSIDYSCYLWKGWAQVLGLHCIETPRAYLRSRQLHLIWCWWTNRNESVLSPIRTKWNPCWRSFNDVVLLLRRSLLFSSTARCFRAHFYQQHLLLVKGKMDYYVALPKNRLVSYRCWKKNPSFIIDFHFYPKLVAFPWK